MFKSLPQEKKKGAKRNAHTKNVIFSRVYNTLIQNQLLVTSTILKLKHLIGINHFAGVLLALVLGLAGGERNVSVLDHVLLKFLLSF